MAHVSELAPELARGVLHLARALLTAARNWTLYPPEHPAVEQSLGRLTAAIRATSNGGMFTIGITPDTLLVEGAPADRTQGAIADAAALLHERDLLQITFAGDVPLDAIQTFLKLLALDPAERRARGGPAQIWVTDGHPSVLIEQVDYLRVLEREESGALLPRNRDDVWRSIVQSISIGQRGVLDEMAQQRLLTIAGSAPDIGDLLTDVMAPKCAIDGSPMITSQAATVLAAFRHLTSIVSVMAPDRLSDVMANMATATSQLDPHVMMQVLQSEDDPDDQLGVVRGVTAAFDDVKVARLLATALALDGQASERLATIFNTIAPDEDRKRRVLSLTRNMLSETDYGRMSQFQALWKSMEELLVTYNDKPFVSEIYRASLDGVGVRAEGMATVDLPPQLPEWMETLGRDNIRSLSVSLLIDLLTLEKDATRAEGIAHDMEALAEDLLMSGAYTDATTVTAALAKSALEPDAIGRDACRLSIDQLGESMAIRETAALAGDLDEATWATVRKLFTLVGPPAMVALTPAVMVEEDTEASVRASDVIAAFGPPAAPRLAVLVGDPRWFVQRAGARLLGRIGAVEGVPLLQPLMRKPDLRVARAAIAALISIDDPSAARAIHTVLRAATGELRRVLADALVADRDPRVVPVLARIIDESEPLGKDHLVVLETIAAMGRVGSDRAVPSLARVIRRRGWFRRRKLRSLKKQGVDALLAIGGAVASGVLDDAARTGDRMLKKVVARKRA